MVESKTDGSSHILRKVAGAALIGAAAGVAGGVGVTLNSHRRLTHKSVELPAPLVKVFDFEQRTLSVDTRFWAAVHRFHHHFADVSLAPFARIASAVDWIRENPDKAKGVEIPESFPHLDPFVDRFKLDEVMKIGHLADDYYKEKLGDRYKKPESYTEGQLQELLNPEKPVYLYAPEGEGDYTPDEMMDVLGRDPHSPALFPEKNGVKSEFWHIPKVNRGLAGLLRTNPDLIPTDLQRADGKYPEYGKKDIALGFAVASAISVAISVARGKRSPKDLLIAAALGVEANAIKIGMEMMGGNAVNALGHGGDLGEEDIVPAISDPEYRIKANRDGKISTKTARMHWVGTFLHLITLGEVGGQGEHHDDPSKIAYTSKRGLEAWREDPYGSLVSFVANTAMLTRIIKPGQGFDLKPGEKRPDEAHPAVELIEQIRAEQQAPIPLVPPTAKVLPPAA